MTTKHDIGALIAVNNLTVPPQNASATATVNGTGFDRRRFKSLVFIAAIGAVTGTPTAIAVTGTLSAAATVSGTYAAVTGGATASIVAINNSASIDVDLGAVDAFVRGTISVVLSAGTTPTVDIFGLIILGGADVLPAV